MSAHTPGPWKHEGQGDITGIEHDGDINGDVDVCSVYLRTLPGRHEANARLIAATPDLLESCENLLEACRISGITGLDIDKAKAAIAKATGQ